MKKIRIDEKDYPFCIMAFDVIFTNVQKNVTKLSL